MDFEAAFKLVDAVVVAKKHRHLKDIEVAILRGSWQGKKYHEIAVTYGCTAEYLKQDVGPKLWKLLSEALGEKVSKTNFQAALERRWLFSYKSMISAHSAKTSTRSSNCFKSTKAQSYELLQLKTVIKSPEYTPSNLGLEIETVNFGECSHASVNQNQDWKEAVDVSTFYGCTEELAVLEQWILTERCRLVAILGMGGVGKTNLSIRIAQQLQGEFEYVIWRSLRHAPPVEDLLADLITFLSKQQEIDLPASLESKILRLLHYLRSYSCLLVLDSAETILCGGDRTGYYQAGYQGYGELIKQIGELSHQSCLLLTSREKPKEITLLETFLEEKVHSLQLNDLNYSETQKIFSALTAFSPSEDE